MEEINQDKLMGYPPPRYALIDISSVKLHEEVIPERVDEVAEDIKRRGVVLEPLIVDDRYHIVLNGHHRLAALRKLGAKKIPAYLVPYDAPYIVVDRWPDSTWHKKTVSKEDVIEAGLTQRLMTPHTSRHKFLFHVEQIPTPLKDLM